MVSFCIKKTMWCQGVGQRFESIKRATKQHYTEVRDKVVTFVKENRWTLLAYVVAWGLILCSVGMLHGFKQTTAPFSIGMGVGAGFGLITGLISAAVFRWKNSLGGRLQSHLNRLDYTTRSLAITVFVAVYLIAATRLPHGIGGLTGGIVIDHLVVKAYWRDQMVKQPQSIEEELANVNERLARLEATKTEHQGNS